MTIIEFNCDRCENHVVGVHTSTGTAGFYNVDLGAGWDKYARKIKGTNRLEHFVCENCMFDDPEYIKVYGKNND